MTCETVRCQPINPLNDPSLRCVLVLVSYLSWALLESENVWRGSLINWLLVAVHVAQRYQDESITRHREIERRMRWMVVGVVI